MLNQLKLGSDIMRYDLKSNLEPEYMKRFKDMEVKRKKTDGIMTPDIELFLNLTIQYEKEIQEIWDKHPDFDTMGLKFNRCDAFVGKESSDVYREAKKAYKGMGFEPLLDFVIRRPGKEEYIPLG